MGFRESDYYPFGMGMPGRKYAAESGYRYGFNGQEKSTEIDAAGNIMTAEFWEYESRLGRRWNIDPVSKSMVGPYVVLGNNPIMFVDPKGNDWYENKKTHAVEWFDTKKDARRAGYKRHLGVNFYSTTDNPNTSIWHGASKEEMHHFTHEQNVTVTGTRKLSIIARSWWGRQIDADARKYRELSPYRNIYLQRIAKDLPISQVGDPTEYTNNIAYFERGEKIRQAFKDGGRDAAIFFLTPFVAIGAVESGATYYGGQFARWAFTSPSKLTLTNYASGAADAVFQLGKANGDISKVNWGSVGFNIFARGGLLKSSFISGIGGTMLNVSFKDGIQIENPMSMKGAFNVAGNIAGGYLGKQFGIDLPLGRTIGGSTFYNFIGNFGGNAIGNIPEAMGNINK